MNRHVTLVGHLMRKTLSALFLVLLVATGCEQDFTKTGADAQPLIEADAAKQASSKTQFNGNGIGSACAASDECRPGLKCDNKLCVPRGDKVANDACILSAECGDKLQCGFFGFCVPSGGANVGQECTSSADCVRGLYCQIQGITGLCTLPTEKKDGGEQDIGGTCKTTADCHVGLNCNDDNVCQPGSVTLNPDLFAGAVCPELEEVGLPFQARTVMPRPVSKSATGKAQGDKCDKTDECAKGMLCRNGEEDVVDAATGETKKAKVGRCRPQSFYSTPFPNDVRIDDKGFVNINDHPVPGTGIVGIDLTANVVKAIHEEMRGFSVAPSVIFRFTRPLDSKSLVPADPKATNPSSNIYFVNLDTGDLVAFKAEFKADRNKYICSNWLVLQAIWGYALHGNTTYGVYITDGIRAVASEKTSGAGQVPTQGDDLAALLGGNAPADAAVKKGWEKYEKLRKYFATKKVNPAKVIAATVFTTQDATRTMRQLRNATFAAQEPVIQSIVNCSDPKNAGKSAAGCESQGAEKPAAGKTDGRACAAKPDPAFHEVHARIKIPTFQNGARPYLLGLFGSKGGGEVNRDQTTGKPTVTGYEDICVGFMIPKGTPPSNGWPLLVYGHGTGGNHRSGIKQMGKSLSALKVKGKDAKIAILGWDQPMHGPRRFPKGIKPPIKVDPGPLFYNFANPPAAKGNFYQGAADLYALSRWVKVAGKLNVTGIGNVKFDKKKTYYMGHSQGGTTGPLAFPWEADMRGAVFSGTGGGLVFSLLNKKSPADATVGMQIALQEADLDEYHPVLALMQYYYDEVDPLIYGPLYYKNIARRCGDKAGKAASCQGIAMGEPKHILHTFGTGDTYTPPQTSAVFAASTLGEAWSDAEALKVKLDPHPHDDLKMAKVKKMPATENIEAVSPAGNKKVTSLTVIIKNRAANANNNTAYDGHFVAFRDKTCHKQVTTFLGTLSQSATAAPTVPDK